MGLGRRKILLTAFGSVLALSFVVFAILFIRYDRGGDPNNEDVVRAHAERAEEQDDPPYAVQCWQRLVALNPFNEEYKRRYYHALVRVRDFKTLAAYTNDLPVEVEFTEREKTIERLLRQGMRLESVKSNDLAVAFYVAATNLNYYAATPYLIDCQARRKRYSSALGTALAYIKRFPVPSIVLSTAEWCALANRPDLIDETRQAIPAESGFDGLVFGRYCDALKAWLGNDKAALASALESVGRDTFKTPVARMMALESAADGDDPIRVSSAYHALVTAPVLFDFQARGRFAVKRFVSKHLPNKLPIRNLGMLADMVLASDSKDLELLRVSLLARLENGALTDDMLDRAEQLHPGDKGIRAIREGHERAKVR